MGRRVFGNAIAVAGLLLLFVPPSGLEAQVFRGRLRRPESVQPPAETDEPEPAPTPAPAPSPAPTPPVPQAAIPSGPLPPSMLQQPAQPATIQFTGSTLAIHADNSSLSEILRRFSTQSGMNLQGLGSDERVFGNFGPGNPRDVLAELLNGTPYNVLMVGDLTNGAPRQLILTPARQTASASPALAAPSQAEVTETGDDSDAVDTPPIEQFPHPHEEIPPVNNPQGVKTPQQLFQELQQMRQQQQQQQQEQVPQQ